MYTIENVLIADDHELVIKGISNLLNEAFDIRNMVTYTDPECLIDEVNKCSFDLYILDLEFENISGFDLIRQIRKIHPAARIIIVTMHDEIWNVNHLLQLNVSGILLKRTSSGYLCEAVRTVLDNQFFVCPNFKQLIRKSAAYKQDRKVGFKITPSEQAVLQYIVNGYSSKQIAEDMCVTENTIEAHRKSLFLKLEARNVAHLVSIAIRRRLVE